MLLKTLHIKLKMELRESHKKTGSELGCSGKGKQFLFVIATCLSNKYDTTGIMRLNRTKGRTIELPGGRGLWVFS